MDAINCDGLASPMTTEGKGGEQRARMVRDFWFFFLKKNVGENSNISRVKTT
jgi:hypothetical protein